MSESSKTAIDIVYDIPDDLSLIQAKMAAIESKIVFLDQKLNMILSAVSRAAAEKADPEQVLGKDASAAGTSSEDSEVMEIRPPQQQPQSQPFSFDRKPEKLPEGPALTLPAKVPEGIRIPAKDIDPMPQNAIHSEPVPEKQTSTLIRGRLKEREGSSIAAVDVKIFDEKSVMVKKTKTAATGEWIAMLPPGEYTAEFTKPGQKPLFKPISVVSGKKELEILI